MQSKGVLGVVRLFIEVFTDKGKYPCLERRREICGLAEKRLEIFHEFMSIVFPPFLLHLKKRALGM